MKFSIRSISSIILAAIAIVPAAANAVVLATFQPVVSSATAGSTVDFTATFDNVGIGTQPNYTITDAMYTAIIGKQVDFVGQFNGAPTFTIGSGITTITDFFSLTLNKNLKDGVYGGLISVFGNSVKDPKRFDNEFVQLPLGFSPIAIQVVSTPEPSQTVALGIGALIIGMLIVLKKRTASPSLSN